MKKSRHDDDIHKTPDVSHVQNPDVAHEESDVNVKAILQFVGGLLAFGIIVAMLMALLFKYFEAREAQLEKRQPPGPMAFKEGAEKLPPEPRLQSAPGFGVQVEKNTPVNAEEIGKIGAYDEKTGKVSLELNKPQAEMEVLNELWKAQMEKGTIDPQTGKTVGLPIEEAKRKLVEQSLPARAAKAGQPNAAQGADVPSAESSGRMMEKRDQ
ncbi:MAG: hypothetical protein QOF02_881 [Blastocatellia bacterium]|jgi:hypothetical protein|nr:hypothetical protein [Blastocatellia bacterium]